MKTAYHSHCEPLMHHSSCRQTLWCSYLNMYSAIKFLGYLAQNFWNYSQNLCLSHLFSPPMTTNLYSIMATHFPGYACSCWGLLVKPINDRRLPSCSVLPQKINSEHHIVYPHNYQLNPSVWYPACISIILHDSIHIYMSLIQPIVYYNIQRHPTGH